MKDVPGTLHPLMTVMAISVTIASLAGIAIIVGVLPAPLGAPQLAPAQPPAAVAAFTTALRSADPVATAPCFDCGTVESVRAVINTGKGIGISIADEHTDSSSRPFDAGDARILRHEIVVRLDDGAVRIVSAQSQPAWHAGERVRLVHGAVVPM